MEYFEKSTNEIHIRWAPSRSSCTHFWLTTACNSTSKNTLFLLPRFDDEDDYKEENWSPLSSSWKTNGQKKMFILEIGLEKKCKLSSSAHNFSWRNALSIRNWLVHWALKVHKYIFISLNLTVFSSDILFTIHILNFRLKLIDLLKP